MNNFLKIITVSVMLFPLRGDENRITSFNEKVSVDSYSKYEQLNKDIPSTIELVELNKKLDELYIQFQETKKETLQ